MTKINFKKSKITTTIVASLIIGLIMLSPMTVLPNVSGITQSGITVRDVVKHLPSLSISPNDETKAMQIAMNHQGIQKILQGKHYKFMASDWTGEISSTSFTAYPQIHINLDDITQLGVVVKHSSHSWHKWMELGNIAKTLFTMGLDINVMGVDDKNQIYRIGFEKLDSAKADAVNKFLSDHNIPLDMIQLVEVGKIIPVNSGVPVNPIKGGAEIGIPGAENQGSWGPTPACTTGFIVKDSAGNYRGLTAEHCQASQNWNNGLQYYTQPYGGRTIGNEKASSGTHTHSDSLLFSIGTETGGYAKIFQYGGGNVLTVTAKSSYEPVGDQVCSVGEGSASTRCGSITYTGQSVYDNGIKQTLTDQVITNFGSVGGDSGSPVWHQYQSNGFSAYGLLWGTTGSTSYYSPVWDIDTDLGTTLTYN